MNTDADIIAEEAATTSVTEESLTSTVFDEGHTNIPVIELLNNNEVAHIVGLGRSKGLAVGSKKNFQWAESSCRPLFIATDSRLVFQFPKENHDVIHSIPLTSITDFEMVTGWTKKRLTIQTTADDYHFYTYKVDKKTLKGWIATIEALCSNPPQTNEGIQTYPQYFSQKHTPEIFNSKHARIIELDQKYQPEEHQYGSTTGLIWKPYSECPHCSTYNFSLYCVDNFSEGRPQTPSDGDSAVSLYCTECEYREIIIE